MPSLDLVNRIQAQRPLPAAQERVARYLELQYRDVPFRTASRIAKESGASKATVVRFVQRLGYQSFDALRDSLRISLYARGDSPAARHRATRGLRQAKDILAHFGEHELANIEATLDRLDPTRVEALCADLLACRTVWVFGQRLSYGIAFNLGLLLSQVLPRVVTVTGEGGTLADSLMSLAPDDHILIVAHHRVGADKLRLAAYARDRGVPYSVLGDVKNTPDGLVAGARHALQSVTSPYGVFNSYASTYVAIQAIASVVGALAPSAPVRLTDAEVALRAFHAFDLEGG